MSEPKRRYMLFADAMGGSVSTCDCVKCRFAGRCYDAAVGSMARISDGLSDDEVVGLTEALINPGSLDDVPLEQHAALHTFALTLSTMITGGVVSGLVDARDVLELVASSLNRATNGEATIPPVNQRH